MEPKKKRIRYMPPGRMSISYGVLGLPSAVDCTSALSFALQPGVGTVAADVDVSV